MKKKAKRYQDGGVLRDRYGNPVRSGSGEIVRTGSPDKEYNEQASASMTESSDYTGRRMKSPEPQGSSEMMPKSKVSAADIGFTGDDEEPRTLARYMRSSPKEDVSSVEMTKEEVKVSKPRPKAAPQTKAASQTAAARKMGEGYMKAAEAEPKSKFSDTGKSVRLNALLKSIPGNPFGLKKGGKVSSASSRGDGIAQRGKTKGRIV